MIKTIIKSMFCKNVANHFIVLGISIFILLPMVLINSSDSVLFMVIQNREEVYGKFSDIYYDYNSSYTDGGMVINKDYMDRVFGDMSYEKYGVLYIVEQLNIREKKYNLGYVDDNAIELGKIKLKEGDFPQNKNQISITESALEMLGNNVGVNDSVNICGEEYTIAGIISDYGRLWPKGEKQTQNEAADIDVFICREDAIEKYNAYDFVSYIILLDRNKEVSSDIQYNDNFYYNTNGQLGEDENLFRVPDGFMVIIFVVCTFLLFNILFLAKNRIERRYHIFWRLGLSKKRSRLYICAEMLVNATIGNVLGFLLGFMGTNIAVHVLEHRIGNTIAIHYNVATIAFMMTADTIIAVVAGNILYGINRVEHTQRMRIRRAKKSGILRLALLEFYRSKKIFITMLIMLAVSISFIYYINQFNTTFVEETKYEEVAGKMPLNYDYELYTEKIATSPMSNGDICIVDTYERDGAADTTLKEILNLKGVKEAYGYKENNKMYILEGPDTFCEYLDISDYFLDGMYNSTDVSPDLNKAVGYEDNTVIRTKVVGYPAEDMLDFAEYVIDGKINIDKLNAGEEIILVVPAFKNYIEECDDGSIGSTLEPVEYDSEGAINDTLFHVGDEILLSELKILSDTNGGMNESEVASDIERKDVKVKIGAIIRSNVGWFEKESLTGSTYKFMSTNEGFENYGIDVTYNRIRVYARDNTDINLLTNELSSIAMNYPRMTLDNRTNQLKNYRELNYLISLMCILLTALVFIVGVVTTTTQMLSKTKIHMEYYHLYIMNGLHFSEIAYLFFIQIILVIVLAIVVMIPISHIIMYSIGVKSFASVLYIITSIDIARLLSIYFVLIIVICVVCSTICVRNYSKK